MTEIAIDVQQQSDGITADDRTRTVSGDREGALFGGTNEEKVRQWLLAGKVFEAHATGADLQAEAEIGVKLNFPEPYWRASVPSSIIVVPIKVKIEAVVIWVTAAEIAVWTSDTDTFNTGGAASDVTNLAAVSSLDSALGNTVCTNIKDGQGGLTEDALTNKRILDMKVISTGDLAAAYEYNILKGDILTYLHGPAAWGVVVAPGSGAIECMYSIVWAELDKNALVNG